MRPAAVLLSLVLVPAGPAPADELTFRQVADPKGDGPDGKGNTADDTWQFWFELAHKRGEFAPLDTHSGAVPKDGVPKKITGPVGGSLPNPGDTAGWIFHRDWDGRFEGVWGDAKAKQVLAYPYVEKNAHLAVAITYKVPADGTYRVAGGVTDLEVQPQFKQHDGVEWVVEVAEGGKAVRKVGGGGPVGDGNGRPDGEAFEFKAVEAKKGQLIRLVIHPRKWWGSDLTRIDAFAVDPVKGPE